MRLHIQKKFPKKALAFTTSVLLLALGTAFLLVHHPHQAQAVSGFNAGNIISDAVMTNKNTMSASDIQTFLNGKVSSCDTNGTLPATEFGRGDLTHAQYAAMKGWSPPPYTCLKDYTEGGESSAQIIYEAAQTYNINPQVLLVVLQKEQSLVTDTWPLATQYKTATGYGCPDTAPCDSQYFGLTNQIHWTATMFRAIENNSPTWYTPYVLGNNYIQYNPEPSCGGSTVNIQNRATQALYNYTPYQPNQAALDAGWGTAYCGSYGNRNFYLYFNNWFDTYTILKNSLSVHITALPTTTPAKGQTVTYTYTVTNNTIDPITLNAVGVVGRLNGANNDLGWQGPITLAGSATQTFTFTSPITYTGTLQTWPSILTNGMYIQYTELQNNLVSHAPNLTLSAPLTNNASTIYSGQDVTFTAKVKNNETVPIAYDALGIPVKDASFANFDATWTSGGTLAPGQEITLSGVSHIGNPGAYSDWVADYYGGTYATIGSTQQFSAQKVTPNFSVSGLNLSSSTPVYLDNITGSFTVTNNLPVGIDVSGVGIVGRYGSFNGPNRDMGWQGAVHFNAGETKTFSGYSQQITDLGTHYYWAGILYQGTYIQYNNWGSTVVSTQPSFSVSGLTLSSTTPAVGSTLTGSFTVTNNLSTGVDVSAVGIVGRYGSFDGPNRDIGWQGAVHFNAGETKTFSGYSRTITDLGTSYYWIGILHQGVYMQYNNWGSTVVSH